MASAVSNLAAYFVPIHLGINHLKIVREALKKNDFDETSWYSLGLELGLLDPELRKIEKESYTNQSHCLRRCLALWLTSARSTTGEIRTWEMFADAVENVNRSVAENIRETYANPMSQFLQKFNGQISKLVLTKSMISQLHSEDLIKEESKEKILKLGCMLMNEPLREMNAAIVTNHAKLKAFCNILLQSEELTHVSLAKDILNECGISTAEILRTGKGIQEISVSIAYSSHFMSIRGIFNNFKKEVVTFYPSPDEMKHAIKTCYPEMESKLDGITTVSSLVNVLVIQERFNIINVATIKTMFICCKIPKGIALAKKYEAELDRFCRCLRKELAFNKTHPIVIFKLWDAEYSPEEEKDIKRLLAKAYPNTKVEVSTPKTSK